MKKQCMILLAAFGLLLVPAYGHEAQAQGLLERLKPKFDGKTHDPAHDPMESLRAPFAEPEKAPADGGQLLREDQNPGLNMPLSQAHMQKEEISEWLVRAVPDMLIFDPNYLAEHLIYVAMIMTPQGWDGYKKFLQASKIPEYLLYYNLEMHVFVEENPKLLNEGVIQDRYRWLYEIPVTMTFLPVGVSYEEAKNPPNRRIVIRTQLTRSPNSPNGMAMETWDVKSLGGTARPEDLGTAAPPPASGQP